MRVLMTKLQIRVVATFRKRRRYNAWQEVLQKVIYSLVLGLTKNLEAQQKI